MASFELAVATVKFPHIPENRAPLLLDQVKARVQGASEKFLNQSSGILTEFNTTPTPV
jgi:hypothetical protein